MIAITTFFVMLLAGICAFLVFFMKSQNKCTGQLITPHVDYEIIDLFLDALDCEDELSVRIKREDHAIKLMRMSRAQRQKKSKRYSSIKNVIQIDAKRSSS